MSELDHEQVTGRHQNAVQKPVIYAHGRWIEDFPRSPLRWLLVPAWALWRVVIASRGWLYDHGIAGVHRLEIPVISIGNLTSGGTGKTPAVLTVVALLRASGLTPAILSRGYRGVDGINEEALLAGDIPVICNPDRIAGGLKARAAGADCLVLDDGFQHRRLYRDLDIVLIDATQPWGCPDGGRGAVIPLGYLREGRRALARADLIWLTRTDLVSKERLQQLRAQVEGYAPLIEEHSREITFAPISGKNHEPSTAWRHRRVILVSGIGNPAAFEAAIQNADLLIIECHRFPDHHHYSATDVAMLMERSQQAAASLVMTGKDAVKLAAFPNVSGFVCTLHSALVDTKPLVKALEHCGLTSAR